MKKTLALLLLALMAITLTGCQEPTEQTGGSNEDTTAPKDMGEVYVYNWGEYIDESIFKTFTQKTGIEVVYRTFEENESLYSVLKTGGTSYDVIIPSDYMISRMIEEDMLEKLDFSNIPNYSLIKEKYKNLEYDPTGEYSVAYMWGTVGIIYNTEMIDEEIDSWSALFDPKYEGQLLQFDNSRDALATALLYLGYSLNTTDEAELNAAYDLLVQQKPLLQKYVMDQIYDILEGGEAAIGPYYAGDFLGMLENNPALHFVVPKEGSNHFVDAMCIPKGAPNKANAEAFINFMCETEICLKNMDATGYASPNSEAEEAFKADLDLSDPDDKYYYDVMYPSQEILNNCEVFINLPQETNELYNKLWTNLKR